MRNIYRSAATVVLVLALAMPAGAASRTPGSGGVLQAINRFIVRVMSRVSPPGGYPAPAPPPDGPTTTTTDAPTKSQ
jgi:hypothetical protein